MLSGAAMPRPGDALARLALGGREVPRHDGGAAGAAGEPAR